MAETFCGGPSAGFDNGNEDDDEDDACPSLILLLTLTGVR